MCVIIMAKSLNKSAFEVILIIGILVALIAAGMAVLYYYGESYPDYGLALTVQNEYSVPVEVRIINTSEGNVPFIVPGNVKWDSEHKDLLYNLSNPKEAALAIVESIAGRDPQALDILMTQTTKNDWAMRGYNSTQIVEAFRRDLKDIDKPYVFELEPGEDDPSEGMLSVNIKWVSGEMRLELKKQPDGSWKM
jgi:hypothetical protein